MHSCRNLLIAAFALGASHASAQTSDAIGSFFAGKTITIIVGYEAGGGYDEYARLFARHASRFIPGHPSVVVRDMPGAGSLIAANYLYKVAPEDGTALGVIGQHLPMYQATGGANVDYDASRLNWIGNMGADTNVVISWHTTGVATIQDAMKRDLTLGATGPSSTSVIFPSVMNAVLGTRFRIVTGYPGGKSIDLAMERGEVGGRGSASWAALSSLKKDWIKQKKINLLVQIGLKKEPELPSVPLMSDLAKSSEDRLILQLASTDTAIGRPIVAPPAVPKDRVAALRRAFDLMMKDPKFLADAAKERVDIKPVSGSELQDIVSRIIGAPKKTLARLTEAEKPRGLLTRDRK